MSEEPLLVVRDLKKHFPIRRGVFRSVVGHVKAVDGVSFHIQPGETLGLVGESGCGKTTVGRSLLRLIEPTAGTVRFNGQDVIQARGPQLRSLRSDMQIVFQDPYGSLNPRMMVKGIVEEGLVIHRQGNKKERHKLVAKTLEDVGLDSGYMNRYPHEFSGGQRQRIGIARALVLNPKLLVLDEPISALDVSIQSQVINLLMDLRRSHPDRRQLTYLFISHDLSVVEYIADRVAVMYLGEIIELAKSEELYRNPLHPYTKALLSSVPVMDPTRKRERIVLEGDVPSPANPPPGCRFHPRCPLVEDVCRSVVPREINVAGHMVRCHVVERELLGTGPAAKGNAKPA